VGDTLRINDHLSLDLSGIELLPIRPQGPGGQNINKVATAIHLRFDVQAASLSETQKTRILAFKDQRISSSGIIVIKAQSRRTQEGNRREALERLQALLQKALARQKYRPPTRPSHGAVKRRLKKKAERSAVKSTRGRVRDFD